jgi:hypothetical protein
MTWAKVDDRLHGHIKAQRAGEAMALWVLALSWCCAYLTDGEVPADLPRRLLGKKGDRFAARLVEVKLWDHSPSGFTFRSWSEYQTERATVEAKRADAKTRMQRVRGVSSDVRANESRTNGELTANESRSSRSVRDPKSESESDTKKEEPPTPLASPAEAAQPLALEEPKTGADAPASASAGGVVVELFKHWQRVHKHPTAKLDAKRRKAIERAVKSHGADVVRAAIDGCAKSAFHQGENDRGQVYVDLTLILRDASKIEGFAALAAPAAQPSKPAPVTQPPLVTATSNVHRFNPFPASAYRKAAGT